MKFNNKVALITGGSSGIGAATAVLFTKNGANVTIVGRNEAGLKSTSEQCEKEGKKPLCIQADISKDDETKTIVKKVIDTFGKLDILVNSAGVATNGRLMKGNLLEEYNRVMNVNLRAAIHLTVLAAPYLIKTKGNIVNVSSIGATTSYQNPGVMPYAISKAGLEHFTKGAALDMLSSGVRVNAVSLTGTNMLTSNGVNRSWEEVALGIDKVSEPEEMAELIAYLASDKARSITGVNYVIDNGALIHG